MSIHYKIHYDFLQKDMAHYYKKIYTPSNVVKSTITNVTAKSTVPLRSRSSEGTSGNNDKMNKLVTLLTFIAEKENEHNE